MTDKIGADASPNDSIAIPGHRLLDEVQPLASQIGALAQRADAISILNPASGFRSYRAIKLERERMVPEYSQRLGEVLAALNAPVNNAPAGMSGFFQAYSLGQSLTATTVLQTQWQRLSSTMDRKAAFLVATASIYLSVLSIVVTVVFGFATLRP